MEGDVIVMQDVFVFEQTGVRRRQDPGPAAARQASGPSSSRSSRSWASTCRAACSASCSRREAGSGVMPAIILAVGPGHSRVDARTVLGLAGSGGGAGISARLERYAAGQTGSSIAASRSGYRAARAAPSLRAWRWPGSTRVVEQRDFGANLARDIARADLSSSQASTWSSGPARSWACRSCSSSWASCFEPLQSPIALIIGAVVGFLLPALLAGTAPARRDSTPSTSSCPTRSP